MQRCLKPSESKIIGRRTSSTWLSRLDRPHSHPQGGNRRKLTASVYVSQCWNLVTGISGAFLTKVLRRRTQFLIAYVGMTAIFVVWTGVSADYAQAASARPASAAAVVAMIFVYYTFYTIMHPLTYIFVTEVFPFVHRAKGVGLTQLFIRAGSAFNQFVNPIGLGNIGWKFYIVYDVSYMIPPSVCVARQG